MAVGIHIPLGGKPPISHRVDALNSFVLPAHEVDVSHAPNWVFALMENIQPDYPAHFIKEQPS
jgi:hypothetical protein